MDRRSDCRLSAAPAAELLPRRYRERPMGHTHFWSLHSGGANWAMADGSVRFIPYQVRRRWSRWPASMAAKWCVSHEVPPQNDPGVIRPRLAHAGVRPSAVPVTGRVTYQGKPVVWGSVTLKAADGSMHQIGINLDGTYRLDRVPVGLAAVGAQTLHPCPVPAGAMLGGDENRSRPGPPPVPPSALVSVARKSMPTRPRRA